MYISIGNSIGSSSNSGGTPAPTTQRFEIEDCVGYSGNFFSYDYPIGEFAIGDRVTFNYGDDAFGKVLNVTTESSSGVDIYATGVNSPNCYNNSVAIGYDASINGFGQVIFDFYCTPQYDFNSQSSNYAIYLGYSINIYIVYNDGDDDTNESLQGTLGPINYNTTGGDSFSLGTIGSNNYSNIVSYQIEYMALQPSFGNTTGYDGGNGCFTSFMRDNYYTISASFRNDDC